MSQKVAVLMGGTSHERAVSLASGKVICHALEQAGYEVLPLDTTEELVNVLREERPDCVYIALHGKHGEDGTIQSVLDLLDIPYVGAQADVARNTWNKAALKPTVEAFRNGEEGAAHFPPHVRLNADAFSAMGAACAVDLIADKVGGYPVCVKPVRQGSALGMSKVENQEELCKAILNAFCYDDAVLIESWIDGVELAVSILGTGRDAYCLPAVEIVPRNGLYDNEARSDINAVDFFAPVRLESLAPNREDAEAILAEIERAALEVHEAFGVRDLSRVDLIWDGGCAQVLECDISPGMTDLSLFPMAVRAAGEDLPEVLRALVEQAIERK